MPRPLLTLAIIVRDEAEALAGLLAGTADLADEHVVVDTGSRDGSDAVAEAAGAVLVRHRWRDDFAAARNEALAAAGGRWILVLDCDERVGAADRARLRHLAAAPADRVYSLPQWNYTTRRDLPDALPVPPGARRLAQDAPAYVETRQIRLFPRRPDLRYAGNVHESLDAAAAAAGLAVVRADVPVHHFGHLPGCGKGERRNRLYSRLLRTKIQQMPEDPLTRYELAVQLANEGRTGLAERLLERTVRDAPGRPGVHRARLLLARLLAARGDHGAALRQTRLAVRERPDLQACWVAAVQAHAAAGDGERAREFLAHGRTLFPHDPVLRRIMDQDPANTADHSRVGVRGLPTGTALANVRVTS